MATLPPAAKKILRYWEWPFVGILAAFMLWVRMLPYPALVGGPRAYYIGTDPFYHYRAVLGIVRAWPRVPRWDPWTFYPNGTATGQFGSLFDWVAALVAIITSGGDPSDLHVQRVLGGFPAVLGALIIVPFYFLARRMLGRAGAIIASITLALIPGEFLIRGIAGYSDHHVAEALMAVVAILGVYVAAERAQVRRADLVDIKNVSAYRGPLVWALLGGLALAANFYTWPPAILFLAILTMWLTVVILLEHGEGRSPRGYVFAGVVSFVTAGILMLPAVETTFIGEFNTYGILQPIACFLSAAGLLAVHKTGKWLRMRKLSIWTVPAALAAIAVVLFLALRALQPAVYASFMWGLSWITGIGVNRTTLTIAEARPADFLCAADSATASCIGADIGPISAISFFLLIALFGVTLWKRRRADILLLIWSFFMFRATDTQIRFSYYVAINIALLIGWLAARVSYGVGLEHIEEAKVESATPVKGGKGRRTRTSEVASNNNVWLKVAAVAAVGLLVLPGNVFALQSGARPGWESAQIRQPDGDLVFWLEGLDWMRDNTPDAGVDLGLVVPRPPPGEHYDYPAETYGVLSWWDYGHWIQTTALRPPVANPFQQAAPFASIYFTDRVPAQAEARLDEWVRGEGPIRYVLIDDAMATGKYGAITVWANSQNFTRERFAGGDYIAQRDYDVEGEIRRLPSIGPAYEESMMGRLYDHDGADLSNYRVVWEHPSYTAIGSVVNLERGLECLHDSIPSRGCFIQIPTNAITSYQPGSTVPLGGNSYAYDLLVTSRLKAFERVEGARLVGVAQPGERVEAGVEVMIQHPDGSGRRWNHIVGTTADALGRFEIRFPYSTTDFLTPEQGGTNLLAKPLQSAVVSTTSQSTRVEIPDRAVVFGEEVRVTFG